MCAQCIHLVLPNGIIARIFTRPLLAVFHVDTLFSQWLENKQQDQKHTKLGVPHLEVKVELD